MKEDREKALRVLGTLTFSEPEPGRYACHLDLASPHDGRSVIRRVAASSDEALEQLYISAINLGAIEAPPERANDKRVCAPRVITRVMDDGVETKDGAA